MGKEILRCSKCESYTLEEEHCGIKTRGIKPAKYGVEDRFGRYRRIYKRQLNDNY